MNTDKPYAEWAYCPACWCRWPHVAIHGQDESKPVKCPGCGELAGRLPHSELNGDQLRELYRKLDIERDRIKREREEAQDEEDDGKDQGGK